MVGGIDGQIQAVDAIATIGGLQRVEVDTRLRQRAPAPYEGFAGTDCTVGLRHITRHNGKVQRADTVATVLRGQGTGIGILHRDPAAHPRIRFAVADGIIDDGLVRGVDRQHQRVDAITAVFRQEGIDIDTGLRQGHSAPFVGRTFADCCLDGIGQRRIAGQREIVREITPPRCRTITRTCTGRHGYGNRLIDIVERIVRYRRRRSRKRHYLRQRTGLKGISSYPIYRLRYRQRRQRCAVLERKLADAVQAFVPRQIG